MNNGTELKTKIYEYIKEFDNVTINVLQEEFKLLNNQQTKLLFEIITELKKDGYIKQKTVALDGSTDGSVYYLPTSKTYIED